MKRLRKIGCGIIVFLLVAIVVAVMVGNYILKNKLAEILQKAVIPAAEAKLKVDLDIRGASVNLFGGSVEFTGVRVGNPEGFDEPSMFSLERAAVDVAIMKAFREKIFEIAEVEIKDSELTIVKNADGLVNLKVLADTLSGGEKAEKPEEKPAEKPEEKPEAPEEKPAREGPTELPDAVLKKLAINKTINYIDHKSNQKISIRAAIDIRNLSTFETEELKGGTIEITASLAGNTEVCKTDLKGNISPITDPMKMTFDLEGEIGELDLSFVQPYLILAGIGSCQRAALKVNLVCNDGVFDEEISQFGLELSNVVFSKPIAGLQALPVLVLPLGVKGTLAEPDVDGIGDVLFEAVKQNVAQNAGALVQGALGGLIGGKKGEAGKKTDPASLIKVPGGDEKSGGPLGGIMKKDDAPASGEETKSPVDDVKKKIKLPF